VAALGIEGLLVVDTEDATLVVPKERAQDVRRVVEALKERGDAEVAEPKTAMRPWGTWSVLMEGSGFKIKRIEVAPGRRLSLQRHARRSEHWVVVQGVARVTRDGEELDVGVNESTYIEVGMVHRLENPGDDRLVIIEVQVGDYVGEDDIERLEDDWAR
jgi:mannose-6-phosphate isomerase-like protein (cupin superfamily)